MIDIIFNAGPNTEAFVKIVTTLAMTTYTGTDGVNVKFRLNAADQHGADEFRAALENLYAANFPETPEPVAGVTTWSDVQAATASEEEARAAYGVDPCDDTHAAWELAAKAESDAIRAYKADRFAGRVGPN